MLKHIPNFLTSLRLILAFLYPFLPSAYQLDVVVAALLTEFLDGYLGRKFQWTSKLGQVLDPIADKVFFASVILTFFWMGKIALWQLLILSVREIVVFLGSLIILLKKRSFRPLNEMPPSLLGKIVTGLHYGVFFMLFFFKQIPIYFLISIFLISFLASINYISTFQKKS